MRLTDRIIRITTPANIKIGPMISINAPALFITVSAGFVVPEALSRTTKRKGNIQITAPIIISKNGNCLAFIA